MIEEFKTILDEEMEWNNAARIILVEEKDSERALLSLVNLRREPGSELVREIVIQDETALKFSLYEPQYRLQLEFDLINVLRPYTVWDSYSHLPLAPSVLNIEICNSMWL